MVEVFFIAAIIFLFFNPIISIALGILVIVIILDDMRKHLVPKKVKPHVGKRTVFNSDSAPIDPLSKDREEYEWHEE